MVMGGEAGQGLVTVGQLLAKSLVRSGYEILVTQSYMSRIRGGHNTFTIRVGLDPIHAPQEAVHLLVAFNQETIELHREELAPDAIVVADVSLGCEGHACLGVPFQQLGQARYHNVAALGVVGALLGLEQGVLFGAVEWLFGKKKPGKRPGRMERFWTQPTAGVWTNPERHSDSRRPGNGHNGS